MPRSIIRNLCRTTAVVGLALVAATAWAGPAGATGKVGPKQYFTGVINGNDGNTSTPITIKVVCAGPASSGQTGHPVGGQTVAVHQLYPPTPTAGSLGYTGNDSEIGVFFNAPPPVVAPPKSGATTADKSVTFVRYDKPQRLPTSLTLPCSGDGNVYFTPIAVVPPSRTQTVPVEYENIAVVGS